MVPEYDFSVDWFSPHWPNWAKATSGQTISKILEIGSFEGRSTCKLIEEFGAREALAVYCIDSWKGGIDHQGFDMSTVEARFDRNITIAMQRATNPVELRKCKGLSFDMLVKLLAAGHGGSFDLVFVDGSHQAPHVLEDLVLSYKLCKLDGTIICDDYLWSMEPAGKQDPLNMPKLAIEAFSTIFMRRITQVSAPLYQVYFRKVA